MLGVYRDGEVRRLHARKWLRGEAKPTEEDEELTFSACMAKYRKMQDGFAPVLIGEAENGFFGKLVRDFRIADWHFRNHADKQFEKNLDGSDLERMMDSRIATMHDFADSEAGSIWRFTHKHPVSVIKPN